MLYNKTPGDEWVGSTGKQQQQQQTKQQLLPQSQQQHNRQTNSFLWQCRGSVFIGLCVFGCGRVAAWCWGSSGSVGCCGRQRQHSSTSSSRARSHSALVQLLLDAHAGASAGAVDSDGKTAWNVQRRVATSALCRCCCRSMIPTQMVMIQAVVLCFGLACSQEHLKSRRAKAGAVAADASAGFAGWTAAVGGQQQG